MTRAREPGWYWVRWLNSWRPAEYRDGEWQIWGVHGLVSRRDTAAEFYRVEIGPRIVPPAAPEIAK